MPENKLCRLSHSYSIKFLGNSLHSLLYQSSTVLKMLSLSDFCFLQICHFDNINFVCCAILKQLKFISLLYYLHILENNLMLLYKMPLHYIQNPFKVELSFNFFMQIPRNITVKETKTIMQLPYKNTSSCN